MKTAIACFFYIAAMATANLLVAEFGLKAVIFNASFLIGLDLSLRDWLHFRLDRKQMLLLICVGGVLTALLNPAAGGIAFASATAFMCAASVDWAVFSAASKWRWLYRSNASNLAGAAVDSVVFPLLAGAAVGGFQLEVVLTMFVAKVAGGLMWSLLLNAREPARA